MPEPTSLRPGLLEANLFNIELPVRISYSRSSITGQPLFDYQDVSLDLHVSGDDITRAGSPLGELVTVTLRIVPDVSVRTLTLVVPRIRLAKGDSIDFETIAVETVDRSQAFVRPPGPQGVLTTYRTLQLAGTAQQVDF